MTNQLDAFLRDYVRPVLKSKGFSKKGRNFRLRSSNGDEALVSFLPWRSGRCDVEFIVDVGVLPLPWIEWREYIAGLEDRSTASALWWKRIFSPYPDAKSQFNFTDAWEINLDDSERIAVFLNTLTTVAEKLASLIDRQNLIAVVQDPHTAVQEVRHTRDHSVALLLVDEGPSKELSLALTALESKNPDDEMLTWLRARLSASGETE